MKRIGLIAEYDALPRIGHGCGHNVISAISTGTCLVLNSLKNYWNGYLYLFGTPAEEGIVENAGGKCVILQNGLFDRIDLLVMIHPADKNVVECTAGYRIDLEVSFSDKQKHTAFDSSSDLIDCLIKLFIHKDILNKKYSKKASIKGVIPEGGEYPNIAPDRVKGKFYIRAKEEYIQNNIYKDFIEAIETISVQTKKNTR